MRLASSAVPLQMHSQTTLQRTDHPQEFAFETGTGYNGENGVLVYSETRALRDVFK